MTTDTTPLIGEITNVMGTEFVWTQHHRNANELQKLRSEGDDMADEIIDIIRIPPQSDVITELHRIVNTNPDEYTDAHISICRMFLEQPIKYGHDMNWLRIAHGQMTYQRYMIPISHILFYSSLVGGVVTTGINEVLKSTGYLTPRSMKTSFQHVQSAGADTDTETCIPTCPITGTTGGLSSCPLFSTSHMTSSPRELRDTMRRLLETVMWIMDVISYDLTQHSVAHDSCIRVRLLHARVRVMLNKRGVMDAINQEDMLVTLVSFSVNIMYSLERLGFALTKSEQDDICYLFGYLGRLMGINNTHLTPFFTSYQASRILGESLVHHLSRGERNWYECSMMASHLLHAQSQYHPVQLPWGLSGWYFHGYRARYIAVAPELPKYLSFPEYPNLLDMSIPFHHRAQYITSMLIFHMEMYIAHLFIHITHVPMIGKHILHGIMTLYTNMVHREHTKLSHHSSNEKYSFHFGMTHVPGQINEMNDDSTISQSRTESRSQSRNIVWYLMALFVGLILMWIINVD